MTERMPVSVSFNSSAEVDVMRRFSTPETQKAAFRIRDRVQKLINKASEHFDHDRKRSQQQPGSSNVPRYADRQSARYAAMAKAGARYRWRTERILQAGKNELKRLDERQHHQSRTQDGIGGVTKASDDQIMDRATRLVDAEFKRAQANFLANHRREEKRQRAGHQHMLRRHEEKREHGAERHRARLASINGKQDRLEVAMNKRHTGIRGKLAGMTTAGRSRQTDERQALKESGDQLRAAAGSDFAALKKRSEEERRDRLFIADSIRVLRADNHEARQVQVEIHQQTRDFKIEVLAQHMRDAEEQSLRQSREQGLDHKQEGLTRTFNRASGD